MGFEEDLADRRVISVLEEMEFSLATSKPDGTICHDREQIRQKIFGAIWETKSKGHDSETFSQLRKRDAQTYESKVRLMEKGRKFLTDYCSNKKLAPEVSRSD
jgi:hypothetical protein